MCESARTLCVVTGWSLNVTCLPSHCPTGLVSPTSSYGENVCWVHSPVLTIVGEAREVRHGQKHERPDTEVPSTGHSELSS